MHAYYVQCIIIIMATNLFDLQDTASLYNKDKQSESAALQQQVQQGPSEVAKVSDHDTGNIPAEDLISKTSRARLKLRVCCYPMMCSCKFFCCI